MTAPGDFLQLTKPRLSALVLLTCGGGLWLAGGDVGWLLAVGTLAGTAMVVGAANTFNNVIERDVDALMARTASRPLPAGRLGTRAAIAFGVALAAIGLPLILLTSNLLTGGLALLALVVYVAAYTPLKSRSPVSTLVGAVPGAMPPLIGWTAANGAIEPGGLALFALLFAWQIPHSLAIGIYRSREYAAGGMRLLPVEEGFAVARRHIVGWTVALVAVSMMLPLVGVGGVVTAACAGALGAVFVGRAVHGLLSDGGPAWARRLFLFSLVHLTALFVALAVDTALG